MDRMPALALQTRKPALAVTQARGQAFAGMTN